MRTSSEQWGRNTLAWARSWVEGGCPDLDAEPWRRMHHVIRDKLDPFFAAYIAADEQERARLRAERGIDCSELIPSPSEGKDAISIDEAATGDRVRRWLLRRAKK